jgi:uncharacterized small protein (DUF1192 family)
LRRIRDGQFRLRQIQPRPLRHRPILVAAGALESKNIPVYFQRVRIFLPVWLPCFGLSFRKRRRGVTRLASAAKICAGGSANMPAVDDDDKPKKKITHEIGQDLTLLSAGELTERIGLLKDEIARLEADMARKRATKSAADTFFKK